MPLQIARGVPAFLAMLETQEVRRCASTVRETMPEPSQPRNRLMYENTTGDRLTLYIRTNRNGDDSAFRFVQDGGVSAFYWLDGPLAYALLAEADRATLLPLTRAVYEKLNP